MRGKKIKSILYSPSYLGVTKERYPSRVNGVLHQSLHFKL